MQDLLEVTTFVSKGRQVFALKNIRYINSEKILEDFPMAGDTLPYSIVQQFSDDSLRKGILRFEVMPPMHFWYLVSMSIPHTLEDEKCKIFYVLCNS